MGGPSHGKAIRTLQGELLYHGSSDEIEYRSLLDENGFDSRKWRPRAAEGLRIGQANLFRKGRVLVPDPNGLHAADTGLLLGQTRMSQQNANILRITHQGQGDAAVDTSSKTSSPKSLPAVNVEQPYEVQRFIQNAASRTMIKAIPYPIHSALPSGMRSQSPRIVKINLGTRGCLPL